MDLDEDASSSAAKHRPPYESYLEESNHNRDSSMFNSSINLRQPSPAVHQGTNDQNAFCIQSLDNNLQSLTYDQLKETDQLAKYSCFTNYEQLPSYDEFETLIKNVQSIYYHADKSSDMKSRQTVDISLLQILHCFTMQKNHVKECQEKTINL